MPKAVDRDERRREIIKSYLAILATEGAEAASTRRLSRELGISNGALWHYFESFDELVTQAYAWVFERTNERIAEAAHGLTGIRALLAMIEQILPLTQVTIDESFVVIHYWGRVAAQRNATAEVQFVEGQWIEELLAHMSHAAEAGELRKDTPQRDLTDALIVLLQGFQIERVLNTPLAENSRQWSTIRGILAPWLTELGRERAEKHTPAAPIR